MCCPYTTSTGLAFALSLLTACGPAGDPDAGLDAGPRACVRHAQCGEELCVREGVAEVELEPGESGRCAPAASAIGRDAPRWDFVTGAEPGLSARLCTAQGLWPGEGTTARRRELLRQAGVRVVRLDLRWDEIERERGVFALAGHDVMVDAAREDGLEVLGILAYGNPWATTATESARFHPPEDPADFARYAGELAAHFEGRVVRWEIWNEQNAGYRFWLPTLHGDAGAYAELLALTASAIHAACEGCEVLSGGLFFHEQLINGAVEFTHDMLTARPDVFAEVDGFAFHPYPLYPPVDPPERDGPTQRSMGAMVADLRAVLRAHAVPPMPLAATELGWPVHGPIDEAEQARLLSRAMLLGAALDVEPLCWFNVTDGPNHGTFPPEDDFGLYRFGSEDEAQPIAPKPARDALAFLARLGEGAIFTGVADDPALHDPSRGRFALDFTRPDGAWRVVFALEPHDAPLEDPRDALDLFGRPLAARAIGPSPIFLVPAGLSLAPPP